MNREWQKAFAKQAKSELECFYQLTRANASQAHRLHLLQMSLEKLSKAYLFRQVDQDWTREEIESTHSVIGKILPQVIREFARKTKTERPRGGKLNRIRQICHEIDRLHPQVDYQNRPDNCEYPWPSLRDGHVIVETPVEYHFPVIDRLSTNDGVLILKIAEYALMQLLEA